MAEDEPVADESDLFYLLVENVISCKETRDMIKHALHPDVIKQGQHPATMAREFAGVSFDITPSVPTLMRQFPWS